MGIPIETMTASKSKRKKQAKEILVNPMGSPTLAERIASLQNSQSKHSRAGVPIAGGTRLVMPELLSTSSDSDRENIEKGVDSGDSETQRLVDWPETESWAHWSHAASTDSHSKPCFVSKSNTQARGGLSKEATASLTAHSAQLEATSKQPTSSATLSAASVNRRLDEILTKLSNLSIPGIASVEEKDDIDLIRNMASLSFEKIVGNSGEANTEQPVREQVSMDAVSLSDIYSIQVPGLGILSDTASSTQILAHQSFGEMSSGLVHQLADRGSESIDLGPTRGGSTDDVFFDDTTSQVSTFSPSDRGPVFEVHTTWPLLDSAEETGTIQSLKRYHAAGRGDLLSERANSEDHPRNHDDPRYPYYGQIGTGRLGIAERVDVFQPQTGPRGLALESCSLDSPIHTADGVGGTPRTANGSAANRSFWSESNSFRKSFESLGIMDSFKYYDEAITSDLACTSRDATRGQPQYPPSREQRTILPSLSTGGFPVSSPSFIPQAQQTSRPESSMSNQSHSCPADIQTSRQSEHEEKHLGIGQQQFLQPSHTKELFPGQLIRSNELVLRSQVSNLKELKSTELNLSAFDCSDGLSSRGHPRRGGQEDASKTIGSRIHPTHGSCMKQQVNLPPFDYSTPFGFTEKWHHSMLPPGGAILEGLDRDKPLWNMKTMSNGWMQESELRCHDQVPDGSVSDRQNPVKEYDQHPSPFNSVNKVKSEVMGPEAARFSGISTTVNEPDLMSFATNEVVKVPTPTIPKPEDIFASLGLSDERYTALRDQFGTAVVDQALDRYYNQNVTTGFPNREDQWERDYTRERSGAVETPGNNIRAGMHAATTSVPPPSACNAHLRITAAYPNAELDGESSERLSSSHVLLKDHSYARETAEIDRLLALLSPNSFKRREVNKLGSQQYYHAESESRISSHTDSDGSVSFEDLSRNESQTMSRLSSQEDRFQLSTVWMNRVTPRAHRIDPPNDVDPAIFIAKRRPKAKSRTLRDPPNEGSRVHSRKKKKEPEGWGIESRSHRLTTMVCSSCSSSTGVVGEMVDDGAELKLPETFTANEDESDLFDNLDEDETISVFQDYRSKAEEPVDKIVGPPDKCVGLPLNATPTVTRRFRTRTPQNLPPRSNRNKSTVTDKSALPSEVGTGVGTLTSSLFALHDGRRSTQPGRVVVPKEIATSGATELADQHSRFSQGSQQRKDASKPLMFDHFDEKGKHDPLLTYWQSIGTMKTHGSFDSISPETDRKDLPPIFASPLYASAQTRQRKDELKQGKDEVHQSGIPKIVSGHPTRTISSEQNRAAKDRRLYAMGPLLSGDSDDIDSLTEDSEKDSVPHNTSKNKPGCGIFMCSDGEWLRSLQSFRF